jgi:hypothetical protein
MLALASLQVRYPFQAVKRLLLRLPIPRMLLRLGLSQSPAAAELLALVELLSQLVHLPVTLLETSKSRAEVATLVCLAPMSRFVPVVPI